MPVYLKAKDGVRFPVEKDVYSHFRKVTKKLGPGRNRNKTVDVDLDSPSLELAIQWATHHKDDSSEIRDAMAATGQGITQWDLDFFGDLDRIAGLLNVAYKLDCKTLLSLGCRQVSEMMRGKTPQQLREMFHIQNDFTPEEIEEMRQEEELSNWLRMIM